MSHMLSFVSLFLLSSPSLFASSFHSQFTFSSSCRKFSSHFLLSLYFYYFLCSMQMYVMRNVEARKSIRMIQLIMAHLCHCINFTMNFIVNFKVNHIKFSSILIKRLSTHKKIDFPYAL